MSTNHCGSCTACCRVYAVAELAKPPDRWCEHCAIGEGCMMYDQRPASCSSFQCLWLQSQESPSPLPETLRPDRCRVVFAGSTDPRFVGATTLPNAPDAWRRKDVRALIKTIIRSGSTVVVGGPGATRRIGLNAAGEHPVRMTEPDENGFQWNIPPEEWT